MVRHFLSPVVTKAVAGFVVGCALVLPARAHAQTQAPPPAAASGGGGLGQGFGEAGQIVISGDPGALSASFVKVNHGGWTAAITPAADYFVVPSVSVGVNATFLIGADSRKGFAIGGRAGYNLNVTENVGAWPVARHLVPARERSVRRLRRPAAEPPFRSSITSRRACSPASARSTT